MAYAYCSACDNSMPNPSPRGVLTDKWKCEQCGEPRFVSDEDKAEVILDLIERVEALELRLSSTQEN